MSPPIRDRGSFGPLQVLMCGAEANRATAGDLPRPQAHLKLQSKTFFDRICLPLELAA